MQANVRIRYVIQCKSSGLFLAESLLWVRSFRNAGRCDSYEAAIDTAAMNSDQQCEVHRVIELVE